MRLIAYFWFGMLLLVSGCQTMAEQPVRPEAQLKERVEAYWATKAESDPIASYPFYTPHYRDEVPLKTHVKRGNITFSQWTLEGLEIVPPGEEAWVTVLTDMQLMGLTFENATVRERWVREDGTWYIDAPTPKESFEKLFGTKPPAPGEAQ